MWAEFFGSKSARGQVLLGHFIVLVGLWIAAVFLPDVWVWALAIAGIAASMSMFFWTNLRIVRLSDEYVRRESKLQNQAQDLVKQNRDAARKHHEESMKMISAFKVRSATLGQNLTELQEKLAQSNSAQWSAESDSKRVHAELDKRNQEVMELLVKLSQLQAKLDGQNAQLRLLQSQNGAIADTVASREAQLAESARQQSRLTSENISMRNEVTMLRNEVMELRTSLARRISQAEAYQEEPLPRRAVDDTVNLRRVADGEVVPLRSRRLG